VIEYRGSIGSYAQNNARATRGRKTTYESRAPEFRRRLIEWKQIPESSRPSLRALARELATSHQLMKHYLDGLEEWECEQRCRAAREMAHKKAKEIRARAQAESRQMTMQECRDAIITPGVHNQIETIRQEAKRGRLNWTHVKTLNLWARHFPQAKEVLDRYSQSALPRKSSREIVKGTPRLEAETDNAWGRRIWDECIKYGTEPPSVITPEDRLHKLISRVEGRGGILWLDDEGQVLYSIPSMDSKSRALMAKIWKHREEVKRILGDYVARLKKERRYEEIGAKICQHFPPSALTPLDQFKDTGKNSGNSARMPAKEGDE
jgi:hypothetical protein